VPGGAGRRNAAGHQGTPLVMADPSPRRFFVDAFGQSGYPNPTDKLAVGTGSCAIAIEAVPMIPSARGTKMNLLAFIISISLLLRSDILIERVLSWIWPLALCAALAARRPGCASMRPGD